MEKNQMIPDELQKSLVETFKTRMANFKFKPGSKKYADLQTEFFIGAATCLDQLFKNETTCMPPGWYFSIMRGDTIN